MLRQATTYVEDPATKTLLSELWTDPVEVLGSGSDYASFVHHFGVPSVDMHFSQPAAQYGQYHSNYGAIDRV